MNQAVVGLAEFVEALLDVSVRGVARTSYGLEPSRETRAGAVRPSCLPEAHRIFVVDEVSQRADPLDERPDQNHRGQQVALPDQLPDAERDGAGARYELAGCPLQGCEFVGPRPEADPALLSGKDDEHLVEAEQRRPASVGLVIGSENRPSVQRNSQSR